MTKNRRIMNTARLKVGKVRKIIGAGKFSSGVRDLGSNKKRLKNFGR